MNEINVNDSLVIAAAGFGTVGVLTGTLVIVSWLKKLLAWEGQRVMWLTTVVAAYAVVVLVLTQIAPAVAIAFVGLYLTCSIATTADAFFHQQAQDITRQAARVRDPKTGQFTKRGDA